VDLLPLTWYIASVVTLNIIVCIPPKWYIRLMFWRKK
jgi:hypothetical protein